MRYDLPFQIEELKRLQQGGHTPCYVYDAAGITETVKTLQKAFSWNKGYKEYFAVKATPTPGILRLLKALGCGFDCASSSEIYLAIASGAVEGDIMFTSNETSTQEYKDAVLAKAIINLDDIYQVKRLEESAGIPKTVCLRYNPGRFSLTSSIMGHLDDSKFGMTEDQILQSAALLKEKGVTTLGLHGMFASNCLDESYYPAQARILFELALRIQKEIGISVSFVDFGGGVGIPYRPEDKAVDIMKIGEGVRACYEEVVASHGMELSIYTELARYITGPHGYLVTSCIGKKEGYRDYIGVDASACDLMRPAIYGAYHHILVPTASSTKTKIYDVVGSLCENNDKFAVQRELPEIQEGDILVIEDAGAHGRSMGYNYNGKMRCGEFIYEDGKMRMIRRRETLADYFATLDVDGDFHC